MILGTKRFWGILGTLSLGILLMGSNLTAMASTEQTATGEAGTPVPQVEKHQKRVKGHGEFKNPLLTEAARILNMKETDLASALKNGQTPAQVAEKQGVSVKTLTEQLTASAQARFEQAVKDGKMPAAKADQAKTFIEKRVNAWVTEGYKAGSHPKGKGAFLFKGIPQELEKSLGLDPQAFREQMKAGKTLADIAKEKGISAADLTAKIQALVEKNLDQAVKDGKVTADQAAKIKADLPQKIDKMINHAHGQKEHASIKDKQNL